jgi:hypothetical protein
MNNYDEIKFLVEASRRALSSKTNEGNTNDIRKQYSLLTEQFIDGEIDVDDDDQIDVDIQKKDSDESGPKSEKQKTFRILNNILVLHGKTKADLQLTTDEKNAFTSSIDEFRDEVAELVDFGKLNVYHDNVEWSGKILEINLEFFFKINEPNGLYINSEMTKVDKEFMEMVGKLQTNYEKFKNKWSKVVASRQEDVEE